MRRSLFLPLIDRIEHVLRHDWLFRAMLFAGVVLPLAYAIRLGLLYDNPIDFRYFWAAGQIWGEGGNPYARTFTDEAQEILAVDGIHRWNYSPHIWGLTRILAQFSFETAFWLWTILNLALIFAGTALAVTALLDFDRRWHWAVLVGLTLYTVSSLGASATQTIGQFSAFIYLACAAFVHAVIRKRDWLMVVALFILTMKASLGLAFVVFALVVPRWWRALVIAGVLSVLCALPPVLGGGLMPIVSGFLDGVAAYGTYEANMPASMTGLRNLVFYATGMDASGLLLGILAALLVGFLGCFGARAAPGADRATMAASIATVLFLVPMHLYDLMLASVLVVGAIRPLFAVVWAASLLVLYRVHRVSDLFGIEEPTIAFHGSYLTSLILGVLFVASLGLFYQAQRKHVAPAPA